MQELLLKISHFKHVILVLSLGLYGQFQNPNKEMEDKIKGALQDVSMADLHTWKQQYLIQNQVVRRRKTLKK